jgi:membrane fusion protein, multidrug efflux system
MFCSHLSHVTSLILPGDARTIVSLARQLHGTYRGVTDRTSESLRPRFGVALIALVVVAGAFAIWRAGAFDGPSGKAGKATQPGVPVVVTRAVVRDAPVDVDSVATVQAFNTALIRARIDGQISRVTFREGARVQRGDVLFEIDRGPFEALLRAAEAQLASDTAKLANAKLDAVRYENLLKADAVTPQVLDAARSLVTQLQASVQNDQAQVDAARLQLGYATIRAPFDGPTGARLLDVGNMVHPGDPGGLVTMTQVQPINIAFSLPQGLLPMLRAQHARTPLRVDAVADDGHTLLDSGELTLIDNQVDATTGTIRCKATFANAREQLWPGSFVTARLHFEALSHVVMVPATAVQPGNDGPFVWLVDAKQRAQVQAVRTGPTAQGQTVVLAGLSGGETVVIEGQFQVEAGSPLKFKAASVGAATSAASAGG